MFKIIANFSFSCFEVIWKWKSGKSTIANNLFFRCYESTGVMVEHLVNPLYTGLLRNVRRNVKQWGVIMSQKLYLFDDLDRPATFIGDLRFYMVQYKYKFID